MTKKIDTPPLGDHVISGIDVSPVMGNYYVKYGGEPIREQLDFFQALGNARGAQKEGMNVNEIADKLKNSSGKHQEILIPLSRQASIQVA